MSQKTCPFCGAEIDRFAGQWPRVCPDCEMELEPSDESLESSDDDSTYALAQEDSLDALSDEDLPPLTPIRKKKKSNQSSSSNSGSSKKSSKKGTKKPQAPPEKGNVPDYRMLIIPILAGVGLLVFCAVCFWLFKRGPVAGAGGAGPVAAAPGNPGAVAGAANPAAAAPGNQPSITQSLFGSSQVILDQPVKPLPITPNSNPWKDDPRIADINYPPPPDLPRPEWPLKADPVAEIQVQADKIPPLKGSRLHAGMNGPFFIDIPLELANLAGPGLPTEQVANHTPVSVYDLQTGSTVGTFPPQAPAWRQGRLSPDGQYLIGPETTPEATATRQQGKVFVWRINTEKPVAEIPLSGLVLWAEFIAPDRFATVSVERNFVWAKDFNDPTKEVVAGRDSRSWLRIWDVTSGAKTGEAEFAEFQLAQRRFEQPRSSVDVPGDLRAQGELPISDELVAAFAAKVDPMPKLAYVPRRELGAVSPGGKYMVLGMRSSMSYITLPDLKIVVTQVLGDKLSRMDYRGFNFSNDGETLYGIIDFEQANQGFEYPTETGAKEGLYLMAWSMRNGRELTRALISGDSSPHLPGLHGPVISTGALNSVVLGHRHIIGTREIRDIPNEFGREGDLPGEVVDFYKGGLLSPLAFIVEREAGNGQGLVRPSDIPVNPNPATPTALTVIPLDESMIRSGIPAAWESRPPRPPVIAADRSMVQKIETTPPAQWSVPKAAAPPPKSTAEKLVLWPDAWADQEFASIRTVWRKEPPGQAPAVPLKDEELKSGLIPDDYNTTNNAARIALDWRRYNPQTGGPIAAPIELWPWAPFYYTSEPTVAALTPAADRLAVVDPADLGRVDVWDNTGNRLVGFRPYQGRRIEWIGWGAGHLLTLHAGRLTAWTVPNCAAVWELNGDYNAPLTLAPGRAWLAANTTVHTDLIDTTTGKILGRCTPKSKVKSWTHFTALSPDGSKLVHLYPAKTQRNIAPEKVVVNIWNLLTGEEQQPFEFELIHRLPSNPRNPISFWSLKHQTATGYLREVVWLDNRFFLVLSNLSQLVDSELRESLALYQFVQAGWDTVQSAYYGFPLTEFLSAEPSGRLWVNRPLIPDPQKGYSFVTTNWRPLKVPAMDGQIDSKLALADPDYVLKPGMSIKIDVDLGTAERSKKGAARIASAWQWRGYKIGSGGWALKLTYKAFDSASTLEMGRGGQFKIPAVEFQWTLLDPAGATIWTGTSNAGWSSGRSKYRGETYQDDARAARVTDFNFGIRDPRQAILDEILDQTVGIEFEWVSPSPRLLLKNGQDYIPLPVEAKFAIPQN